MAEKSARLERKFFETSACFSRIARGTTQIAAFPLPLLDSSKSYALTRQSREGSTTANGFLPSGSEDSDVLEVRVRGSHPPPLL